MERGRRAGLIVGGTAAELIVLYLLATLGQLPARVAMGYDSHNRPTWYATRGTFYAWFLVIWIGINLIMLLALRGAGTQRAPGAAVAEVAIAIAIGYLNVVMLAVFHLTYQRTATFRFLPLSANQTMILLGVITVPVILLGLRARLRGSRRRLI